MGKLIEFEEVVERASKYPSFQYTVLDPATYKNARSTVTAVCSKHGKFCVSPFAIMRGYGCPVCRKLTTPGARNILPLEMYKQYATEIHHGKYDYSLVTTLRQPKIPVICKTHGVFMIRHSAHISPTQLYGCQKCSRGYSAFEARIEDFLVKHGINYVYQKKFPDLVGKRNQPLPYDFFLPDMNLIIEYDGDHHYKPVKFGSNQTPESMKKKFADIVEADAKKNRYAMENKLNIMRISSLFADKIELILEREILGVFICGRICDTPVISWSGSEEDSGKQISYCGVYRRRVNKNG